MEVLFELNFGNYDFKDYSVSLLGSWKRFPKALVEP